jgi:hypothetical protein
LSKKSEKNLFIITPWLGYYNALYFASSVEDVSLTVEKDGCIMVLDTIKEFVMIRQEFEEMLLDKMTLSSYCNLPNNRKIEFYTNLKKYDEEATKEEKAFWDETHAWISRDGKYE